MKLLKFISEFTFIGYVPIAIVEYPNKRDNGYYSVGIPFVVHLDGPNRYVDILSWEEISPSEDSRDLYRENRVIRAGYRKILESLIPNAIDTSILALKKALLVLDQTIRPVVYNNDELAVFKELNLLNVVLNGERLYLGKNGCESTIKSREISYFLSSYLARQDVEEYYNTHVLLELIKALEGFKKGEWFICSKDGKFRGTIWVVEAFNGYDVWNEVIGVIYSKAYRILLEIQRGDSKFFEEFLIAPFLKAFIKAIGVKPRTLKEKSTEFKSDRSPLYGKSTELRNKLIKVLRKGFVFDLYEHEELIKDIDDLIGVINPIVEEMVFVKQYEDFIPLIEYNGPEDAEAYVILSEYFSPVIPIKYADKVFGKALGEGIKLLREFKVNKDALNLLLAKWEKMLDKIKKNPMFRKVLHPHSPEKEVICVESGVIYSLEDLVETISLTVPIGTVEDVKKKLEEGRLFYLNPVDRNTLIKGNIENKLLEEAIFKVAKFLDKQIHTIKIQFNRRDVGPKEIDIAFRENQDGHMKYYVIEVKRSRILHPTVAYEYFLSRVMNAESLKKKLSLPDKDCELELVFVDTLPRTPAYDTSYSTAVQRVLEKEEALRRLARDLGLCNGNVSFRYLWFKDVLDIIGELYSMEIIKEVNHDDLITLAYAYRLLNESR